MPRSILFLIIVFYVLPVKAQWYDADKVDHNAMTIYNLANNKARAGEYPIAIQMINEALKKEPRFVDAYLSLAGVYGDLKDYSLAVSNFAKAIELDSVYTKYYLLPYSIDLAGCGHFNEALDAVNNFLNNPTINERSKKAGEFRKKTYEFAVALAMKNAGMQYDFTPINLGDSINTPDNEYFPSLTVDRQTLTLTRKIKGNEDIYISHLKNGGWSAAAPLSGNINSDRFNEGGQNISQDGTWMIFTGCNLPNGFGSCDLYISYLTKNGWSEPQNLGPNVNSEFWESTPSLSPDKRDLYFSGNMPDGFGGKDIWVCHRNEKGKWSEPENLGPTINTDADESTPFIHADNQTLYFNSNGLPGYSEKPDLFMTKKLQGGKWSEPINLGYPINTIDDEGSMVVASDGKTAYYSSDKSDTKGGLDIYSFQLPPNLQALKTLWTKGKVYDSLTHEGLPSTVVLTDIATKTIVSKLQTDEEGNYLVTLPVGKDYAFNVQRKGYLFYSENFNISATTKDSVFKRDIPLQPLIKNAAIVLNNIFFDTKKWDLKPESLVELEDVVSLLNENPNLKIRITGFTDNIGSARDNITLSKNRAISVVNYIISKGIGRSRLEYSGLGVAQPIASNETEEGRSLNRRTELTVISN
ncbi:MAG: OmpA family protein [Ginsengibacter sp.]